MNERDYRLILDLHKENNITRVAQLHYLSQPAVTKHIRRIEEELGCEIILRSKKGTTFTPAGEMVVEYCANMVSLNERLQNSIFQMRGVVGGSLSVGSSLNYSRYRLPSALKKYQELYPQVNIDVSTGHSDTLYQMLMNNRISVAIVRGNHAWAEGSVLLSTEPMCFVCNRQNSGRPLSEYPYIGHHSDAEIERMTERWLIEKGVSPLATLWIDDIASCREMADAGVGWTIIPSICLGGFEGDIIPLALMDGTPLERSTYIIYRNSRGELPQVKCFIDILIENEKQHH